jgi:hypothetical protein
VAKKDKKAKSPPVATVIAPQPLERAPKVPVALRFNADLLTQIDAMAQKRGMSRNALISYWCSRALDSE